MQIMAAPRRGYIARLTVALALVTAMFGSYRMTLYRTVDTFYEALVWLALALLLFMISLALQRAPAEHFAPVIPHEPRRLPRHRVGIAAGVVALVLVTEINTHLFSLARFLPTNEHLQFALLVGGALLIAWGLSGGWHLSLGGRTLTHWRDLTAHNWTELAIMGAILLLALALRVPYLEATIPGFMDEVSFTINIPAFEFNDDIGILQPINSVAAFPRAYIYLEWISMEVFGYDLNGFRLVSALLGALTAPALYWLARHLFRRQVGIAAGVLLATLPVHLQFSRVGMNNVGDPLFGVLAFALLARGLRYGGRANFALAGVALGFAQYFHEAGRLTLPVIALVWLGGLLLLTRNRRLAKRLALTLGLAVILALPMYVTYSAAGMSLVARVNDVGLRGEDWQAGDVGAFISDLLMRTESALQRLIYHPERVLYYAGETPYLLYTLTPFLVIGLAYALWRWSRPATALLLLWVAIPFAGIVVFLAEIMSPRTTVFLPPLMILTALGIVHGLRMLLEAYPRLHRLALVAVVAGLCVIQTLFYFGYHLPFYRHQMFTLQPWQQVIFEPRRLPQNTQIHLLTYDLADQNYLNAVFRFTGNDTFLTSTYTSGSLTAADLGALPRENNNAFIIQMPDPEFVALLESFFPDIIGPMIVDPPVEKTNGVWFVTYLLPARGG